MNKMKKATSNGVATLLLRVFFIIILAVFLYNAIDNLNKSIKEYEVHSDVVKSKLCKFTSSRYSYISIWEFSFPNEGLLNNILCSSKENTANFVQKRTLNIDFFADLCEADIEFRNDTIIIHSNVEFEYNGNSEIIDQDIGDCYPKDRIVDNYNYMSECYRDWMSKIINDTDKLEESFIQVLPITDYTIIIDGRFSKLKVI